jgi:transposase
MAERIKHREIERTVGLDVGDRWSQICVLDQESGEVVEEGRVRTRAAALERRFRGPRMRVVLEVGCQSPWISRLLGGLGHEVLVANARRVALIHGSSNKSDRVDAESLARLGRYDPKLLRSVEHRSEQDGVGPITALAFVLKVEDPRRFASSRTLGPYLGLVPRRDQSGVRDPQLRITKQGDPFVRRLLIQCARYLLGPFGKDCAVRRHGLRIGERGGPNAKKRAAVAVARKLAVLLHHLWLTAEVYEPFHHLDEEHHRAA